MDYSDHHIFRIDDLKDIRKKYEGITADKKMIITTEKDAVRLTKFTEELRDMHLYVLPIRHKFLFNAGSEFDEMALNFIRNFKMREEVVEE